MRSRSDAFQAQAASRLPDVDGVMDDVFRALADPTRRRLLHTQLHFMNAEPLRAIAARWTEQYSDAPAAPSYPPAHLGASAVGQ